MQKITQGILEIRIIEGTVGEIEIKGNRYFKSSLLRKKIALKRDQPFNYNTLRRSLGKINAHPDRTSRVVLMPGKKPGSTDMVVNVEDRWPVHIGFDWDNFGSRYVEKNRYRTTLTHNNLLGRDDILTFQYQTAEGDTYWLTSTRYLFPLTDGLDIGFSTARTKLALGKEFKDLNARGKSRLYSLFAIQGGMLRLVETL